MTPARDDDLSPLPEPSLDPPEPEHPDELDTVSPGLTDESGDVPVASDDEPDGDDVAKVSTEEPTA
jgi:hypothetical protein